MLEVVETLGRTKKNAEAGGCDFLAWRGVLIQFNLVGIWNAGMDNRWRVKIRGYHCAQHSWNPAKPNPANAPRLKHKYEREQPRSAGNLDQQFDESRTH